MAQENFVVYTPEIDAIIKEEAKKSPKNLAEGFRNAAERIESEVGEKNITPEKVQARYYLKFNKRKATTSSSGNGNGNGKKKTATKASNGGTAKTAKNTVRNVETGANVTEGDDVKFQLSKAYIMGLPREKKLEVVKELWTEI